jgi:hypothetical protein
MPYTALIAYSEFVDMFEPSGDFSSYQEDDNIEIEWKGTACKNPAREASGLWCAFLWKPASENYEGKWIRQEYNGSSPFALWWLNYFEDEEEECDLCGENATITISIGGTESYFCKKCHTAVDDGGAVLPDGWPKNITPSLHE